LAKRYILFHKAKYGFTHHPAEMGSAHALRAKRAQHLPTLRSKAEVNQVLNRMFATHLLEAGHDIRMLQELLGHKDVVRMFAPTIKVYTHLLNRGPKVVRSPLDE
jgi:integrase